MGLKSKGVINPDLGVMHIEPGARLLHIEGEKATVVLVDRKNNELLIFIEGKLPGHGYEVLKAGFQTRGWTLT